MKVRQVMEVNVITIPSGATYEEVARILYTHAVSGAPVVDSEGKLIGAVSEKDLFRILYPFYNSYYEHPESYTDFEARENKINEIRSHSVDTFMSKTVHTISPDEQIMRAGALMLAKGVNRLPVMENGKLVGVISRKHIYRNILKRHFEVG